MLVFRANMQAPRKLHHHAPDVPEKQNEPSRALAKGLQILEALAGSERARTLAQLASAIGLGKASTFRLTQTLVGAGYVTQNERAEYELRGAWTGAGIDKWARILGPAARPEIERLCEEISETVSLGLLCEDHIRVFDTVESPRHVRMSNYKDRILPPYASSLGKAIAAFQTPEMLAALINVYGLYPVTENTLTDLTAIRRDMETVRELGYSREYEETVRGGCCFAAPIRDEQDRVRAAVSVSMPVIRLTEGLEKKIPAMVIETADRITAALRDGSKNAARKSAAARSRLG
jgi:IclR family acetate operon transcriptional repressor